MSLDLASIDDAAEVMVRRRPTVALTGAGVSVESGIPDFRSRGGLWERFNPAEYASIEAFRASPEKVWKMLRELESTLDQAEPNSGHRALAKLEQAGIVEGLITQNIDNLHQVAGSEEVVEFHGNGRWLVCLDCDRRLDHDEAKKTVGDDGIPRCSECGSILKPDVIFFGEAIPDAALTRSYELADRCEVMLVAGTSATVMPAAAMPLLARRHGATLIEVNIETTELTSQVDIALRGRFGDVLPALADAVSSKLDRS
jgi:NAD-dependent deacetylase